MVAKSKATPPMPARPSPRHLTAGDMPAPGNANVPRPHYRKPTPDRDLPKAKKIGTDSHPDRPMITAGTMKAPGNAGQPSRNYNTPTPDMKGGERFGHKRNMNGV